MVVGVGLTGGGIISNRPDSIACQLQTRFKLLYERTKPLRAAHSGFLSFILLRERSSGTSNAASPALNPSFAVREFYLVFLEPDLPEGNVCKGRRCLSWCTDDLSGNALQSSAR